MNYFDLGCDFSSKVYDEYSKVEKPDVLNMSYEGYVDEEELKIDPVDNKNNNVNVVSDSYSDSSDEDFKNNEGNFLTRTSMIKL